jgi:hypothetical protein
LAASICRRGSFTRGWCPFGSLAARKRCLGGLELFQSGLCQVKRCAISVVVAVLLGRRGHSSSCEANRLAGPAGCAAPQGLPEGASCSMRLWLASEPERQLRHGIIIFDVIRKSCE